MAQSVENIDRPRGGKREGVVWRVVKYIAGVRERSQN